MGPAARLDTIYASRQALNLAKYARILIAPLL